MHARALISRPPESASDKSEKSAFLGVFLENALIITAILMNALSLANKVNTPDFIVAPIQWLAVKQPARHARSSMI
ncbi:Uncharacterized protein MCB1EB_1816 [Mycoavidus cysteinexigens]|uniref:Uncharacterized protein n=1 Tax=Mycoavidus cysteinexigens TaxID=1553431 RepID=A0A2Z6EWZ6_9BURK|nr:Uncharacterized protein MCB1EB_1816 [Mycoavidus cysteinexigens]GLR02109.1 hypothetical protein GCM10007934_19230 [Mycoavidus cysteinexigens]